MRQRNGRLKPTLNGIEGFARTGTPGSTLTRWLPAVSRVASRFISIDALEIGVGEGRIGKMLHSQFFHTIFTNHCVRFAPQTKKNAAKEIFSGGN